MRATFSRRHYIDYALIRDHADITEKDAISMALFAMRFQERDATSRRGLDDDGHEQEIYYIIIMGDFALL